MLEVQPRIQKEKIVLLLEITLMLKVFILMLRVKEHTLKAFLLRA